MTRSCRTVALLGVVAAVTVHLSAQTPPPVHGTMALEGTVKSVYMAANKVIVTTIDGVEHVYQFTKNLVVHGGKSPGPDGLKGVREGSTVVVHYTSGPSGEAAQEIDRVGDEGLQVTEGMVTRIDRRRQQITIRFDNGSTETFRLTDRASTAGPENQTVEGGRVVVYYADESGQKMAHYFKKAS